MLAKHSTTPIEKIREDIERDKIPRPRTRWRTA
jgi:hypothetical protein